MHPVAKLKLLCTLALVDMRAEVPVELVLRSRARRRRQGSDTWVLKRKASNLRRHTARYDQALAVPEVGVTTDHQGYSAQEVALQMVRTLAVCDKLDAVRLLQKREEPNDGLTKGTLSQVLLHPIELLRDDFRLVSAVRTQVREQREGCTAENASRNKLGAVHPLIPAHPAFEREGPGIAESVNRLQGPVFLAQVSQMHIRRYREALCVEDTKPFHLGFPRRIEAHGCAESNNGVRTFANHLQRGRNSLQSIDDVSRLEQGPVVTLVSGLRTTKAQLDVRHAPTLERLLELLDTSLLNDFPLVVVYLQEVEG